MGTKSEVRNRIKKVMAELGLNNQAAFARALGLRPTTLNAWMTRTSLPSPDAYMALGKVALSVDDSLFFFEQAGLTEEAILAAAAKIMKGRTGPGVEGEIIQVPRFRETLAGREEAVAMQALVDARNKLVDTVESIDTLMGKVDHHR